MNKIYQQTATEVKGTERVGEEAPARSSEQRSDPTHRVTECLREAEEDPYDRALATLKNWGAAISCQDCFE